MIMSNSSPKYDDYWVGFSQHLKSTGSILALGSRKRNTGSSLIQIRSGVDVVVAPHALDKKISVELLLEKSGRPDINKKLFHILQVDKNSIESEFGFELKWMERVGVKRSRIVIYNNDGDPENKENWQEQFVWLEKTSEKFYHVFTHYLEKIIPDLGLKK